MKFKINDLGRECSKCFEFKGWDNFCGSKGKTRDKESTCKKCNNINYQNNKAVVLERVKRYASKNKDKIAIRMKAYRLKNKEKLTKQAQNRYQNNKEAVKEKVHQYYQLHKEDVRHYKTQVPTKYKFFKGRLTIEESPREGENGELEVKCAYCKEYFQPAYRFVADRCRALNSDKSENRLYCSQDCKDRCPVFNQKVHRKGEGRVDKYSDARSSEWRDIILEIASYKCEECDSTDDVQAHHVIPIAVDYTISADISNGIALCKKCHIKKHTEIDGCSYNDVKECI